MADFRRVSWFLRAAAPQVDALGSIRTFPCSSGVCNLEKSSIGVATITRSDSAGRRYSGRIREILELVRGDGADLALAARKAPGVCQARWLMGRRQLRLEDIEVMTQAHIRIVQEPAEMAIRIVVDQTNR